MTDALPPLAPFLRRDQFEAHGCSVRLTAIALARADISPKILSPASVDLRIIETTPFSGHAPYVGFLTSAQGRSLRAKRGGQRRAAFWRVQGFPNLVLARAEKAAKRQQEQARAADEESRRYAERLANQIDTNLQALLRR